MFTPLIKMGGPEPSGLSVGAGHGILGMLITVLPLVATSLVVQACRSSYPTPPPPHPTPHVLPHPLSTDLPSDHAIIAACADVFLVSQDWIQ